MGWISGVEGGGVEGWRGVGEWREWSGGVEWSGVEEWSGEEGRGAEEGGGGMEWDVRGGEREWRRKEVRAGISVWREGGRSRVGAWTASEPLMV